MLPSLDKLQRSLSKFKLSLKVRIFNRSKLGFEPKQLQVDVGRSQLNRNQLKTSLFLFDHGGLHVGLRRSQLNLYRLKIS